MMNRLPPRYWSFGLVASGLLLACRGQVLSFTGSTTSALAGIDTASTIAQLTDADANKVCAWLSASFPGPAAPVEAPDSGASIAGVGWPVPGYVTGAGFGCAGNAGVGGPVSLPLTWVDIPESDCVPNLRHSACEATLASLESCIQYFAAHYTDFSCNDARAACAAYEGAAGCDETVLQGHNEPYSDSTEMCGMALPVEAGVTCPASSADGGTD